MKAKKVELLSLTFAHNSYYNVALQQLLLRLLAFEMKVDTKRKRRKKRTRTQEQERKKKKVGNRVDLPTPDIPDKLHNQLEINHRKGNCLITEIIDHAWILATMRITCLDQGFSLAFLCHTHQVQNVLYKHLVLAQLYEQYIFAYLLGVIANIVASHFNRPTGIGSLHRGVEQHGREVSGT